MKEEKLTNYPVIFKEIKVTEHSYNVLCGSKDEAISIIGDGHMIVNSEVEVISIEREIINK